MEEYGTDCRKKHKIYKWVARIECKATIIADSLCKWVKDTAYIDVQSIPGLNLSTALHRLKRGLLCCQDYEYVLVHLSTNDLEYYYPDQIVYMLNTLIVYIKRQSPFTTIGISSILPRPKDGNEMHDHRIETNNLIKQYCDTHGCTMLQSWRCVIRPPVFRGSGLTSSDPVDLTVPKKKYDVQQDVDMSLFAADRLHLNRNGISALKDFVEGALTTMVRMKAIYE